eukprot:COSAG06_NODE_38370_length_424_cov_1.249231_1_plen_51_part_10
MSRVVVQPVPQPPYHIATRSLRRWLLIGRDAEGSLRCTPRADPRAPVVHRR